MSQMAIFCSTLNDCVLISNRTMKRIFPNEINKTQNSRNVRSHLLISTLNNSGGVLWGGAFTKKNEWSG